MSSPINLAVIVGSVRQARFGPNIARWFGKLAEQHGQFDVTIVDLAETEIPLSLGPVPPKHATTDQRPPSMAPLTAQLESADAFVVVTPEYNHSYPASIKALIDWHYTEWRAKPVGFVSYGAHAGGLRAVEALRPVFAQMHAVTMRDSVSFVHYWGQFDQEAKLRDPSNAESAAKILLDQLIWWADSLRTARANKPYTG